MNKKYILFLPLLLISIISLLLLLLKFARLPNDRPNGFIRNWVNVSFDLIKVIPISTPLEKISGISPSNIFFTVPNPQWIIMMDTSFTNQDTIGYGLQITNEILGTNNTIVDSPDVYFFANNIPALLHGRLNSGKLDTLNLQTNVFTRSDKISNTSIIVRALDKTAKKQVFQKININNGRVIAENEIIKNQQPGGFESDGWLKYDCNSKYIYYVEFYRNIFYCLDTNLKLLYKGNTIDTISNSNISIKLTNIEGSNRFMPTTPRIKVNKDCMLNNKYLFITSGLRADNQSQSAFRNNATLDIYDLKNGQYIGSSQIPLINGDKLKNLTIKNNLLITLHAKHISLFKIKWYFQ